MCECRVDMYGENAGDGMNAPETWEEKIVCVSVCVVILGGYYTVKVEKGRQHITIN